MKQVMLTVFSLAAILCGCSAAHRPGATAGEGTLQLRVTSLLGLEARYQDARIYVDGRFVGHYEPDQTVLQLPPGRHTIVLEVPRAYAQFGTPNGGTVVRWYALKGKERVEVLGGESKQSLVFNDDNLKRRQIAEE
jgi:hypothetical protein